MVISYLSGQQAIGTSAERIAATWTGTPTGYQFRETDTGLIYYWNGTAWSTISSVPGGSDVVYVYKDSVSSNYIAQNSRTGAISSNASPDAPIAAALALGSVRFSGNDFILSGGFTGFSIGANCTVSCSASTFFTVPQGYTGYVFKMGTGNPSYFQGGQIREGGTAAHLWTAFNLQSSTSSGLRTTIKDVQITNPGTGIKLLVDNVAGYINSCYIGNIFIFQPVIGIDFQISGTTWSGGDAAPAITHNTFDTVIVQCYAGTTHGFKNIQNCDNVFVDCNTWDANTGNSGAGCYRSHFHATDNLVASHPIIQGIMTSTTAALFSDALGAASIWDRYTGIKPNKQINAVIKSLDVAITSANSPYTLGTTSDVVRADATGGNITINLPTAIGIAGTEYHIFRTDIIESTNIITIDASSTQTIDGNLTYLLFSGEWVKLESDGANWQVLDRPQPSTIGYYFRKGSTANRRYLAGQGFHGLALINSTTSPTANTLYAYPFVVSRTTKFDLISFSVSTLSSGNARAGIYRDTGNCYPGVLIFDTGSISTSGTLGMKDTTITSSLQTFQPGLYWLVWETDSATGQYKTYSGITGVLNVIGSQGGFDLANLGWHYSVAHTFGALPDPFTAAATVDATSPAAGTPRVAVGLRPI